LAFERRPRGDDARFLPADFLLPLCFLLAIDFLLEPCFLLALGFLLALFLLPPAPTFFVEVNFLVVDDFEAERLATPFLLAAFLLPPDADFFALAFDDLLPEALDFLLAFLAGMFFSFSVSVWGYSADNVPDCISHVTQIVYPVLWLHHADSRQ